MKLQKIFWTTHLLIISLIASNLYAQSKYIKQEVIRFNAGFDHPTKGPAKENHLGFSENEGFHGPTAINCDNDGNVLILDTANHRIQKFSPNGSFLEKIKIDNGKRQSGQHFCIDDNGNIYVLEQSPPIDPNFRSYLSTGQGNSRKTPYEIRVYNNRNELILTFFLPLSHDWMVATKIFPTLLYIGPDKNLYVGGLAFNLLKLGTLSEFNNIKTVITNLDSIVYGIPLLEKNSFITTLTNIKEYKLNTEIYSTIENKIINYDSIFGPSYVIRLLLKTDKNGNNYFSVSNRSLLQKDDGLDYREICVVDKNGNVTTVIQDLPDNLNESAIQDLAVDNDGNIYYLHFTAGEGVLVKWSRK